MSDDLSNRPDLSSALTEALPTYEAPPALAAWALEQARQYDATRRSAPATPRERSQKQALLAGPWRIAAGFLLAAALGWGAGTVRTSLRTAAASTSDQTVSALIDTHVRSLLPGHLIDVQSSDRHTVKPWFAGRIDIAPPVVDLAAKGFPLIGGRLDYVQGHSAAALVYGRRLHMINLFVWHAVPGEPARASAVRGGYAILHWTTGDLSYWAVSDAAPAELEAFGAAYSEEALPPISR
jgi:anti-sigma factor RsiW